MPRLALPSNSVLLAGFVAAACIYIFFLNPWGHDTWFHLQRLLDVEAQLGRRQLPHFGENVAQGKGLPIWVYYSHWIYWPAILLTFAGATPLIALKIVYCIFLVLCGVGCYLLLRLHTDSPTAAFGTLAFLTSNFVIGEIFTRSAYAEFLSVTMLPWLLFAMHRMVVQKDGVAAPLLLVFAAAWMILSHLLTFMNAVWAIAAYAAYLVTGWRVSYSAFVRVIGLLALSLALTSFFWMPAVIEMHYVLGAAGVPTKIQETFLTVFKYLNFASVNNIGFVLDVLGAIVVLSLLFRSRQSEPAAGARPPWALVAGISVYVFLTLRISAPLYELSFLASNLWVFRVLFPLALLVVILIVDNLGAVPRAVRSDTVLSLFGVLAVLQATTFVVYYTRNDIALAVLDRAETEQGIYPDTVRLDGFGVAEYLPNPRVLPRAPHECRTVQTISPPWDRGGATFEVDASEVPACIHVPRYWNIRYEASIDGRPTPVYADANNEVLLVADRLSGEAVLRVKRPAYVLISAAISALAAMLVLIIAVRSLAPAAAKAWSRSSERLRRDPTLTRVLSFARLPKRRSRFSLAMLLALVLVAWWWLSSGEEIVPALSAVLL